MELLKRLVKGIYPVSRFIKQRDEALRNVSALIQERDEARQRVAERGENPVVAAYSVGSLDDQLLQFEAVPAELPPAPAASTLPLTDEFRRHFTDVLLRTFYRGLSQEAVGSAAVQAGIADHLDRRYLVFAEHLLPWVQQARSDLSTCTAVEIGSGTGASTLAFAPHVRDVICYEIDEPAIEAAKERMLYFGLQNVEYRAELFGPQSEFVTSGRKADIVVLCAVLEHMSFDELIVALRTAWEVLQPGGLLVIADTPNRFAIVDQHTSLLPYYSALPYEVLIEYAKLYSPRDEFRDELSNASGEELREKVTRWGRGISYHDFELAIGPHVHDHVVLDGYEPVICAASPPTLGDALLRFAFARHDIKAHRAFTRSNLYLVMRK